MIPALQSSTSIGTPSAFTSATHARTEAGSASSQATGIASIPSVFIASAAFSRVRAAATTRAPRAASTRALSAPRPEFEPVMRTVRPVRSRPAVTSSAVEA